MDDSKGTVTILDITGKLTILLEAANWTEFLISNVIGRMSEAQTDICQKLVQVKMPALW